MKLSLLFGSSMFATAAAVVVSLAGCGADPNSLGDGYDPSGGAGDDGTGAQGGAGAEGGLTCGTKPDARKYVGFGKTDLVADRADENVGVNRARVKPYSVLAGEFTRTIGAPPASLTGAASTFGQPGDRWYEEAELNAVSMSTAYGVAFDGCLAYTKAPPELAAAPTTDTANAQCAAMMKKFWDKSPTPDEVSACTAFATGPSVAKEPDARRKWSYVCASVLTSTRFLTF